MTEVLLFKAHAHDNHKLLSYHDNAFCNTINYHTNDTIAHSSCIDM